MVGVSVRGVPHDVQVSCSVDSYSYFTAENQKKATTSVSVQNTNPTHAV